MNSLWGLIDQISEKKSWSWDYILEGVSWANLIMMSSDRIRLVRRSEIVERVSKDQLKKHREKYGKS